ncbi:hypothetical protein J6590_078350 [Homalodisca vitripennis]|nr:hypothetical protein J6590_078350 [Homalodisca vitripennis]
MPHPALQTRRTILHYILAPLNCFKSDPDICLTLHYIHAIPFATISLHHSTVSGHPIYASPDNTPPFPLYSPSTFDPIYPPSLQTRHFATISLHIDFSSDPYMPPLHYRHAIPFATISLHHSTVSGLIQIYASPTDTPYHSPLYPCTIRLFQSDPDICLALHYRHAVPFSTISLHHSTVSSLIQIYASALHYRHAIPFATISLHHSTVSGLIQIYASPCTTDTPYHSPLYPCTIRLHAIPFATISLHHSTVSESDPDICLTLHQHAIPFATISLHHSTVSGLIQIYASPCTTDTPYHSPLYPCTIRLFQHYIHAVPFATISLHHSTVSGLIQIYASPYTTDTPYHSPLYPCTIRLFQTRRTILHYILAPLDCFKSDPDICLALHYRHAIPFATISLHHSTVSGLIQIYASPSTRHAAISPLYPCTIRLFQTRHTIRHYILAPFDCSGLIQIYASPSTTYTPYHSPLYPCTIRLFQTRHTIRHYILAPFDCFRSDPDICLALHYRHAVPFATISLHHSTASGLIQIYASPCNTDTPYHSPLYPCTIRLFQSYNRTSIVIYRHEVAAGLQVIVAIRSK